MRRADSVWPPPCVAASATAPRRRSPPSAPTARGSTARYSPMSGRRQCPPPARRRTRPPVSPAVRQEKQRASSCRQRYAFAAEWPRGDPGARRPAKMARGCHVRRGVETRRVTIQRMLPFPYRRSRTAVGAHKRLLANEKKCKITWCFSCVGWSFFVPLHL